MKKAVLYQRVSSSSQMKGHGLQRQFECNQEYAAKHGMEVVGVFSDVGPGDPTKCPGLKMAARQARAQGASLLVETLCRATRNGYEPLEKVIKDVPLVMTNSLEDELVDKMNAVMLNMISEIERRSFVPVDEPGTK